MCKNDFFEKVKIRVLAFCVYFFGNFGIFVYFFGNFVFSGDVVCRFLRVNCVASVVVGLLHTRYQRGSAVYRFCKEKSVEIRLFAVLECVSCVARDLKKSQLLVRSGFFWVF